MSSLKYVFALLIVVAAARPAAAQTEAPPPPPPAASATQGSQPDPDLQIVVEEPDFALAALPTTLRMPARKFAFRLTHRFSRPIAEGGVGYSCLAEVRTVETLKDGKPKTPFLKFGDRVRIEMLDAAGRSIFGAIDQVVERHTGG